MPRIYGGFNESYRHNYLNNSIIGDITLQFLINAAFNQSTPGTGTGLAIPMEYYVAENTSKFIMLSAWSENLTYNLHSYADYPSINWSVRYKDHRMNPDGGGWFTGWSISSLPTHGTLYADNAEVVTPTSIVDSDSIIYVPDQDYTGNDSFTFFATDSTGTTNEATISIIVAAEATYPLPLGMPAVSFGLNETPPADPVEWPSAQSTGFYYIDSDHPSATDTSNTYGYPDKPRVTIPGSGTTFNASSKMVIVAASTPYSLRTTISFHQWNFSASSGNEFWIVGIPDSNMNLPEIRGYYPTHAEPELRLSGGNLRIKHVDISYCRISPVSANDNTAFLHCYVSDNPHDSGNGIGLSGTNLLYFDTLVRRCGRIEVDLGTERDVHAWQFSSQSNVWVLDSGSFESAGDSIQLGNNNTTQNIYVGRHKSHGEGENTVDIKDFNNVLITECDSWDIRLIQYGNSGGNAQSFYFNDEGVQQNWGYLLNNRAWDTGGQCFGDAAVGGNTYIIGNIGFMSPSAYGLATGTGAGNKHFYFNTIYNVRDGMWIYTSGSATGHFVSGNYVSNASRYNAALVAVDVNQAGYNTFAQTGTYAWGSNSSPNTGTLSQWESNTPAENSIENIGEQLTNPGMLDFTVANSATMIDSIPASAISTYFPGLGDMVADLGITFTDRNDTTRPQNTDYDPGALEAI